MVLVSAFHCLFRGITPNTSRLIGRLALVHSSGLNKKLFVGGLSFDTNEKVLRDAFSLYGEILEVRVIINRASGLSKGFGFVQFASETDAVNALKEMDGQSLDGRNIRVNFANTRARQDSAPPKAVVPDPGLNPLTLINKDMYIPQRIKRS